MTEIIGEPDKQITPIEIIVIDKIIKSKKGNLGIFPRADVSDITDEKIDEECEIFKNIFGDFVKQFELKEPSEDVVYYHNRLRLMVLEMGFQMIGKDPFNISPHFVIDLSKALQPKPPILVVRLDDHLGVSAGDGRNNITVWGYNPSTKEFTEPRIVKSDIPTDKIYNNLLKMVRWEKTDLDPFHRVASSEYSL